jgi:F0F1-type ATP synthase assembly protein I
MRKVWETLRVAVDFIRGVVLGVLVCYAIYRILFTDIIGPLFRYAGY